MRTSGLGLLLGAVLLASACESEAPRLRLATTTSTRDSGLLDTLIPVFEKEANVRVDVIAVGTGKALKFGEAGDVDVVLVHARSAEDAFMAAGHGRRREDLMRNSFVLLGPPDDPAGVNGLGVSAAMAGIAETGASFVSRGDDSGTHKKELELWAGAGGLRPWDRYFEAGQGMGRSLIIANEKQAYILADRGTYLALRAKTELVPMTAPSKLLENPYGVIVVDGEKNEKVDVKNAHAFVDFLISERGQRIIADFEVAGEKLFIPARLPAKD